MFPLYTVAWRLHQGAAVFGSAGNAGVPSL